MGDRYSTDVQIGADQKFDDRRPDFGQYEYPERYQVNSTRRASDYHPDFGVDSEGLHSYYYSRNHGRQSEQLHCPVLEAYGAKAAYLGALGKLVPTKDALKAELLKAGDIGEQLVQKMTVMEKEGWAIGNRFLSFPEPKAGLEKAVIRDFDKLSRVDKIVATGVAKVAVSIMNAFDFWSPGAGMSDRWKYISYNGNFEMVSSIARGSLHGADPLKKPAIYLAHELSHNDGIPKEFLDSQRGQLSAEEKVSLAKRLLITEARAHLTHSAVSDALVTPGCFDLKVKQAIKDGKLGSYLSNMYQDRSKLYEPLKCLTAEESDNVVNKYFARHFGEELIDPTTGKFRSFDINAGLDEKIGSTRFDDELLSQMKNIDHPTTLKFSALRKVVVRGGQAVLGAAALAASADLVRGFHKGADVGLSQVARAYSSMAGYELGSAILGSAFRVSSKARFWGAIAGGVVGSSIMDGLAGKQIEHSAKDAIRNLGKTLNIAYLAPEQGWKRQ